MFNACAATVPRISASPKQSFQRSRRHPSGLHGAGLSVRGAPRRGLGHRRGHDIDNLTFACGAHHKLLDNGWRTRKLFDGTTEWIPPPQQNHGQPTTNNYHHPQRYLTNIDEDSD